VIGERTRGRPVRRRTVVALLGRSAVALVLLVATGAVVAAGVRFPTPDTEAVAPAHVEVPAAATVLVCPGPLHLPTELEPGQDVSYDPQYDTAPGESATQVVAVTARSGEAGAADATLRVLGADADAAALGAAGDIGVARLRAPTAAVVVRADAVDQVPAWVAATLHVRTDAGDLRGLVTAPCQRPAAQSWLVGGSTELGSSARLVLANPGLTPASVTVRMWGASGPVELAGSPEFLVPPGSERVVLLEGVAAEQGRVVVEAAAVGGLVTAYLQDSRMLGLVPAGVDDVVAGNGPALRQVVSGVSVTGTEDAEAAVLRVLAPGDEAGTIDVTLLGPDGPVSLPGADARLAPGTVLDIPLSGVDAGDYTAVVTADVPVVAGAMLARGGGSEEAVTDRAWVASGAGGAGPLAVPDGVTGRLVLAVVPDGEHLGRSPVTVRTADGATVERLVAEGTTTSIPLENVSDGPVEGVVVRTDDPRVVWSVVLEDEDMVSVLVPVPPLPADSGVAVRVR
jgi:hypothetical protein